MLAPLDRPIVCPVTVGREPHLAALDRLLDQLVAGQGQTLLMVIEDIHWADETSLELLRALARTAAQRRLLLVLTYRSDEVNDALRGLLTSLDRARLAVELRLQRLSRDELDVMLRAMFQLE